MGLGSRHRGSSGHLVDWRRPREHRGLRPRRLGPLGWPSDLVRRGGDLAPN